jgi:branched-chain amino acid transport system substrate-binding protein
MGADAQGIFISGSYVTNIETPQNHQFLAAMSKRFGSDLKTPNDLSVPEYEAVYLYKAAVEKAGSFDTAKVIPALAQVSFDGPRGKIQMSKQRHTPLTMYLAQVQADGSLKVIESVKNVDPGEQCPNLK